jgi:hypothetical protein
MPDIIGRLLASGQEPGQSVLPGRCVVKGNPFGTSHAAHASSAEGVQEGLSGVAGASDAGSASLTRPAREGASAGQRGARLTVLQFNRGSRVRRRGGRAARCAGRSSSGPPVP